MLAWSAGTRSRMLPPLTTASSGGGAAMSAALLWLDWQVAERNERETTHSMGDRGLLTEWLLGSFARAASTSPTRRDSPLRV
jgi:hypothetical protein